MHLHIKPLILLISITYILAGCTISPDPISPPPPPQSLTDGNTPVRAEAGPITLIPPKGFLVENRKDGLSLNGIGEDGNVLIGFRVSQSSGQSADDRVNDYMAELPLGWNRLIDNEEVSGISGRGSRYSLEDDAGNLLTGRVIALNTAERDYLIFAVMGQEDWILSGSADFSTMLSSLVIDDNAVAQVNLPATDAQSDVDDSITSTPIPVPTDDPPSIGLPPFTGQSADGYACFAGFETGLICITPSGKWAHYTEDNSDLTSNSIFSMTSCPDGRILVADVRWITVYDGVNFTKITPPNEFDIPDLMGCGPNGEIWLDDFEGLSLWRDNKWEFFEKSTVVQDIETLFEGLEIGPDGTAWVMSFNEVASLPPGQSNWTIYAEGAGLDSKYYFDGISLDESGTPYLSFNDGYIWLEDDQWLAQEADSGFFGDLEVTIDQHVYLTKFNSGLLVVDGNSTTFQTVDDGLSRNDIDLIESDDQGRIWVTTETGVDIYDGNSWTQLRMGNSELGHTRFRNFVIVGKGPIVPTTKDEPAGSLTGQLLSPAGLPLINTPIELCLNGYVPYNEPEVSPCQSSVESFKSQTDEVGLFSIENMPSGWYELFFTIDGVWQELQGDDSFIADQILIESGLTTDIGPRQIKPK